LLFGVGWVGGVGGGGGGGGGGVGGGVVVVWGWGFLYPRGGAIRRTVYLTRNHKSDKEQERLIGEI